MFKFEPIVIKEFTFKDVCYHRNGVGGTGFYSALVQSSDEEGDFIITYFDIEEECCCAVYNLNLLPDISHPDNSWRGDQFVDAMKEAVNEHTRQFSAHLNKLSGLTD